MRELHYEISIILNMCSTSNVAVTKFWKFLQVRSKNKEIYSCDP